MQIMIAAATTKGIDNLAREFSNKQQKVNMMSQCIFLSAGDGFLSTFPSVFKPTYGNLEKGFPPFFLKKFNFFNLSFKFIFLFLSYVEFSCLLF